MQTPYYRECLNRELSQRLARNPGYSLRAFAKALEVPVSSLSRAIAGKRSLSVPVAAKIAGKLRLSPRERTLFISSLSLKATQRQSDRPTMVGEQDPQIHDVDEQTFRIIADWYHFAILEMTFLKAVDPDPRSIASKLGISPLEASLAISRLVSAGLLERTSKGLKKSKKTIWAKAKDEQTNDALLEHHRQCLLRATDAVTQIPYSERASSTMTMPIDPKKVPLARRMIEEFAVDLCQTLSSGAVSDVFQLTIDFHSLLIKEKNK